MMIREFALITFGMLVGIAPTGSATVFNDAHTFNWTPGGLLDPAMFTEVDSQFYTDFAGAFNATSSYDDQAPLAANICVNPGDPGDCYPLYDDNLATFSIELGGQTITDVDFGGANAFIALIGGDKWSWDSANPGTGLAPLGVDIIAIATEDLGQPVFAGPANRWQIHEIVIFVLLPNGTLADPATLAGVNFYDLGATRQVVLRVTDTTTGITGRAIAQNPEPGTAILLGVGLAGLSVAGRKRQ